MTNIQFKGVHKSFGSNKIITDFNLDGKEDEFLVFVGPSGCGKSTLLNIISGNIRVKEGQIYFSKVGKRNYPKISYLNQDYSLYDASIEENIAFGIPEKFIDYEKVRFAAKLANIDNFISNSLIF